MNIPLLIIGDIIVFASGINLGPYIRQLIGRTK